MKPEPPIYLESWKGYAPIATVAVEPQELERRLGVEFKPSHDDLDEVLEAAVRGDSGRIFGLVRHVNSPMPGTQIYSDSSKDRMSEALGEALEALHLSVESVVWVYPSGRSPSKRQASVAKGATTARKKAR